MIDSWQNEAYFQYQNFAERCWQIAKCLMNWVLNYTGTPLELWLLCLEYVCNILNITALKALSWRTPMEALMGVTPNFSIIMTYQFYQPIYYMQYKPKFPQHSTKAKGWMVGFNKHVGNELTYKVLTASDENGENRQVIRCLHIHPVGDKPNLHVKTVPSDDDPQVIKSKFDMNGVDSLAQGRRMLTIPP